MRIALLTGVAVTLIATAVVAQTPRERGAYLVEGIMACGTCHARPGQESADIPGELAGGIRFRLRGEVAYAANITPDIETGIGRWSEHDIVRALRAGRRPDGSRIGGMPFELYRRISDSDALAIAAYLRALPAVRNEVPRVRAKPMRRRPVKPIRHVADVPRTDKARYGAYLAGPLGRCIECHTPSEDGGPPDYERMLGAGGVVFSGPWGEAVSGNITPDPDTGLGEFSNAQIKLMIVSGQRPNRTRAGRPMAHTYYQKITAEDLDAIVAYLRSLKPIKNFIDK